jgi:hypothetical protein
MVSFRISNEEYNRFREICFTNGMRSISEMARTAMNMLLERPALGANSSLEARLTEIEARLHLLSREIKTLNHYLPQRKTAAAGAGSIVLDG